MQRQVVARIHHPTQQERTHNQHTHSTHTTHTTPRHTQGISGSQLACSLSRSVKSAAPFLVAVCCGRRHMQDTMQQKGASGIYAGEADGARPIEGQLLQFTLPTGSPSTTAGPPNSPLDFSSSEGLSPISVYSDTICEVSDSAPESIDSFDSVQWWQRSRRHWRELEDAERADAAERDRQAELEEALEWQIFLQNCAQAERAYRRENVRSWFSFVGGCVAKKARTQ